MKKLFAVGALLAIMSPAQAAERAVPFWPDEVPAVIRAHVDGVAMLETVRELGRFHRVQGSPGFAAAAEHVKKKLRAAGLADAAIERFPADGKTRYAHFRSYYDWNPVSARLEEVSPRPALVASFPELPVALADYSQDADVTAELVDAKQGTDPKDYAGKDVRGKIVLADGALPAVHRLACEERGAVGFLSAFPNQTTPWSGDDRDQVRWGHLSPYQLANRFAFMVSKHQAEGYRSRLAAGEKVVLRARVRARMVSAGYDVVVATIPGTERAAEEVVLTAHLCHQSAGANDNASGSAAILEVARALQVAISDGSLPKPRRTIRFLWLPEIAGSQAYLIRHPEVVKRLVAGIHMDMVGGLPWTIRGTFHVSRSAETLPHAVNEIVRAFFDQVVRASARYAERGGDGGGAFVWPPGSREAFLGDVRGIEMGSDHEVFQAAGFRVPMVYFHDYPDVTIHTQKDQPENLDATKLGRVAYIGAATAWTLAALPDSEAPRLLDYARGAAEERIARARMRAVSGADHALGIREAVSQGNETLSSVARLWPVAIVPIHRAAPDLAAALAPPADSRVPVRNPEIRGPLGVYYYDHLPEALGQAQSGALTGSPSPLSTVESGDLLAYEALNLADGRRTVSEIRDILSGRYEPVAVAKIAGYFDLLEKAKVIEWKAGPEDGRR